MHFALFTKVLILTSVLLWTTTEVSCKSANDDETTSEKLITAGAKTAAVVGAGTYIASAGLGAAGFTASGIVGGSLAAVAQAKIGAVAAGSVFAGLQSLGATGVLAATGPLGLGVAAIGGGVYYLFG